jgi:hypothetical protein
VRWRGGYLEVRAELSGESIELRFDPEDECALSRVFVDRTFVCDTVPLDRLANMHRRRRRIAGEPDPRAATTGLDPLGLIEDEHPARHPRRGPAPLRRLPPRPRRVPQLRVRQPRPPDLWLVGLPALTRRLHMQQHAALRSRIAVELRLEPLDRDVFGAAVEHGFKAAGASQKILAD